MKGALTNIEDIKTWFFDAGEEYVFYSFYSGYPSGNRNNTQRILTNKDVDDKQLAWEMLEKYLKLYSAEGGEFKVHLTNKPGDSNGLSLRIRLPRNTQPAGVAGVGMTSYGIGTVDQLVKKEIERYDKVKRLEDKIADLEYEISSPKNRVEEIIGVCERLGIGELLQQWGPMLAGLMTKSVPPQFTPAAVAGTSSNLESQLGRLQNIVPGVEITTIIKTLADAGEKNPELVKMFMSQNPTVDNENDGPAIGNLDGTTLLNHSNQKPNFINGTRIFQTSLNIRQAVCENNSIEFSTSAYLLKNAGNVVLKLDDNWTMNPGETLAINDPSNTMIQIDRIRVTFDNVNIVGDGSADVVKRLEILEINIDHPDFENYVNNGGTQNTRH